MNIGLLPYIYQVTKYDPADRDEHGHYVGVEDVHSDHGPVESAYLAAVAAFAEDTGVSYLAIREPAVSGAVNFGVEPPVDGHGLAGLFPPDLAGYHDGARISVDVGLELVRAMLRDNGAWCRLEAEDRFFIHVGWDQYVYVGSTVPCERAVAYTHERGLFTERIAQSPHDPELTEDDVGDRRPADAQFWSELTTLAIERGAVVLEEGFLHNASRWHRLTAEDVDTVRTRITPRSRLLVWPDLSPDVDIALAGLPPDGLSEIVWLDRSGLITSRCVDETDYVDLPTLLSGAQAAMVLSGFADERHPLLSAVMPDPDGVLRARWAP